jgi:hypothetical protein
MPQLIPYNLIYSLSFSLFLKKSERGVLQYVIIPFLYYDLFEVSAQYFRKNKLKPSLSLSLSLSLNTKNELIPFFLSLFLFSTKRKRKRKNELKQKKIKLVYIKRWL